MTTNNQQDGRDINVITNDELREKIEKILMNHSEYNKLYFDTERLVDLFTTQLALKYEQHAKELELAVIDAKIEELDIMPIYFEQYAVSRIMELTKQRELLNE